MTCIIIEDSFIIGNQPYDALVRRVSSDDGSAKVCISAIARSIDDEMLVLGRDDVQKITALFDITKGRENERLPPAGQRVETILDRAGHPLAGQRQFPA